MSSARICSTRDEQVVIGRNAHSQQPESLRSPRRQLRVALIAGTLVQDGAEKQLVYMARALRDAGVEVRVYCLRQSEFYEGELRSLGIPPYWVGRFENRLLRLLTLGRALREFRPDIVQSTHFYTNLYAALGGRLCGALVIGCSRNDVFSEVRATGHFGWASLMLPGALLVNSEAARRNAQSIGVKPGAIHVVANVIDLADFDARSRSPAQAGMGAQALAREHPLIIAIGRLVPQKRFDRYLEALARARLIAPKLKGMLVGEGPDRDALESCATALGLLPDHVAFLGRRNDVPRLLRQADLLVLTSDHEGFPNVVLEAMTAGRPVVTTPAGDAGQIVQDGVTGYVVPSEDTERLAERIAQLCTAPDLRAQFGRAARRRAEQDYGYEGLADRLLTIYGTIARRQHRSSLLLHLQSCAHAVPLGG
jgi:glycosyltransferase involved in cell wall biosynthesis